MQFIRPKWNLKKPRCECCSGQGALCFSTCPKCGYIVLVCDEVGTVYPNPHDLETATYGGIEDDNCTCPGCRQVKVSEFRDATADEIQAFGFTSEEYE